jgi:hypothetical protein
MNLTNWSDKLQQKSFRKQKFSIPQCIYIKFYKQKASQNRKRNSKQYN